MFTHATMPAEVRNSAYCHRDNAFFNKTEIAGKLYYFFLHWANRKAFWLIYAYAFLGRYVFTEFRHAGDKFVLLGFAAATGTAILLHWLMVLARVPRADKRFPLVSRSALPDEIRWTAMHMLSFALFVIFLTSSIKPTPYIYWLFGLGLAALMYGWVDPAYGYVPCTRADIKAGRRNQLASERSKATDQNQNHKLDEDQTVPVELTRPTIDFSGIFGMQAVKDKLLEPAKLIIAERDDKSAIETPANGILLHGDPGNGKTVFAEALAGQLKVPFIQMTYGDTSTQWMGKQPRVIANAFAFAKRNAPCVLFLDEIDSYLKSRDGSAHRSEEGMLITNTLLTEIVRLRGHRVVLIGATNYLSQLDAAAIREGRFDHKVEITPPDEAARIGLMTHGVKKYAAQLQFDEAAMLSLAKRWNGFSVSRILAVVKGLPTYAKDKGITKIGYDDWMATLREVQGRNGKVPEDTKPLKDLVLEESTKAALTSVAKRLKDVARVESLGGTLPSGVLFYGPSGTGKTAAARALAKEADWAFLSVAGPDLLADRDKITKVYAEAKDIRPTLIFIDEADDALRDRQFSSSPDLTNRMLALMDGVDEKVKDVVFIAATNHPDQIDSALLRAGRFTEKIEFSPPPQDQVPRFVSNWLKGKGVMLAPDLDAWEIATMLEGQTIANIEGVLQYALNQAIHEHQGNGAVVIRTADMNSALKVVVNG